MKKNQIAILAGSLCLSLVLSSSCQSAPAAQDHVLLITSDGKEVDFLTPDS